MSRSDAGVGIVTLPADIAAAIEAASGRSTVPLDVRWRASVASTMDVAADAAEEGAPDGFVIVADEQTAGRGRRGHTWSSPPGAGLYLSFVLRPPAGPLSARALPIVTLAAGVATRRAIVRASGLAPDLKWPNDLMCGHRKLAGILAEAVGLNTSAQTLVLGIGVNVLNASHLPDVNRRATSLEAELGRGIDRSLLLEELLVAVPAEQARLWQGEADDILRAWRDAAPASVGASVECDGPAGSIRGVTEGIDAAGALLVRTASGVERVISGEVRWLTG